MKTKVLAVLALSLILATACKNATKKTEETVETEVEEVVNDTNMSKTLTVTLNPKSDSNVSGTVTFTEKEGKIMMTADMTGLSEGTHAIHIHETADCSSPDGKSTGGHWNPTAEPHGKWGDEVGFHRGDIGNFEVGSDGIGTISMTTDKWCLGCDDPTMNIMGKAIIVHAGADDFTSQPSGAAGARISCAGIIE
ncbi:superoxide dismutase family protein [Winogradskyella sp. DF17]|uniref:Superoxide dismutase family protein n=1 Tax=Winogradskyella pelagia TaxID=2819984 RepID=A0ABS3T075_9FLAO|nr:superoxide dismutase family protein [Winogradskyella sp. DF17]MBO3116142.1 superoxide dismutase family protein [Winogradskyella sp. DF17]